MSLVVYKNFKKKIQTDGLKNKTLFSKMITTQLSKQLRLIKRPIEQTYLVLTTKLFSNSMIQKKFWEILSLKRKENLNQVRKKLPLLRKNKKKKNLKQQLRLYILLSSKYRNLQSTKCKVHKIIIQRWFKLLLLKYLKTNFKKNLRTFSSQILSLSQILLRSMLRSSSKSKVKPHSKSWERRNSLLNSKHYLLLEGRIIQYLCMDAKL